MNVRQLTRATAVSAAAVGLGLTLLAGPASASVIVDTDEPLIFGTNVEFGTVPNFFDVSQGILRPGGPGLLEWESDGGVITPHLVGLMHTEDLAGSCAKMRIKYYAEDANGNYLHLATRGSPEHCPDNDDWEMTPVDIAPFGDPTVVRVVVATTVENGNGNFVINDSQTFNLN